eukprot:gene9200-38493_t
MAGARDPVVDVQTKPKKADVAFFSPIFMQAFTLTFIAEWGDRSQIATIALSATANAVGVCVGGKVANALSPKHVTFIGGMLFVIFGALTAYQLACPPLRAVDGRVLPWR